MFLDIDLKVNPSSSHPNFWISYNDRYNIQNEIHIIVPVDASQNIELMALTHSVVRGCVPKILKSLNGSPICILDLIFLHAHVLW